MTMNRASLVLLAGLALIGCGKDSQNHPPEFHPEGGVVAPKTCGEVRQGEPSGGVILIEGGMAGCAAEGQQCPLSDLPTFADACIKGAPSALCYGSQWKVHCDLDAGVAEAGEAGSDAAGDASGLMDASSD
jgi:hypothetical protein